MRYDRLQQETPWSRDVGPQWGIHQQDPPPWNRLLGPVHARGAVSGTIVVDGKTVISWGEPERADLTFSVAKTYLALLAGVAHDSGLLPDVHEPVGARARGIGFDAGRNARVTWEHLLQQTSEWEGECFGVPDQVDRYRTLQFQGGTAAGRKGDPRPLHEPGTYWEYNDVRINQLALALLHLFHQPLPEVFEEALMQPLECGAGWRWRGYDDAWVDLGGRRVQSVPGGTHWGAGVSISARDQSRLGQLLLDDGKQYQRELIPSSWVRRMRAPCAIAPYYGWLLWLNGDGRVFPGASTQSYCMVGAGGHLVWIEPAHHAVVVVRWMDPAHTPGFMRRMSEALGAS
jgi:CubicO group peptidase (beta-lactamase class C family)